MLKESFKVLKNPANSYFDYGAYSMFWPLFTFGDFLGNIYIMNLFDRSTMHRVPLSEVDGLSRPNLEDLVYQ